MRFAAALLLTVLRVASEVVACGVLLVWAWTWQHHLLWWALAATAVNVAATFTWAWFFEGETR